MVLPKLPDVSRINSISLRTNPCGDDVDWKQVTSRVGAYIEKETLSPRRGVFKVGGRQVHTMADEKHEKINPTQVRSIC